MAQAYECDRCGGLNNGKPHTRIKLGDGVPRRRPRGYETPQEYEEGAPITEEANLYDICPGCRSDFEGWFENAE